MNIGFIKLDKLTGLEKLYKKLFKVIRIENNTYYLPDLNEKIISKLIQKLKQNNIDCIISEKNIDIEYNRLDGKYLLKCAVPEVIKYCYNALDKNEELEEIYILAENYTKESIKIIESMLDKVKVVNIVTNHLRQFQELEKRLERKEIYITVSSNKRKALKRAELIINLDFNNFNGFNVNKNSIIVNCNKEFKLNKDFEGICIENIDIKIDKIMRIFSENENMDKKELFEAELLKQKDLDESRYILEKSKMIITGLIGKRGKIDLSEFNKIKSKNEKNSYSK